MSACGSQVVYFPWASFGPSGPQVTVDAPRSGRTEIIWAITESRLYLVYNTSQREHYFVELGGYKRGVDDDIMAIASAENIVGSPTRDKTQPSMVNVPVYGIGRKVVLVEHLDFIN